MLLDTTDYPPLYYAITGFFMVVFGPDISVARLSSFLFVVPLLVIMGRLGWQVAGHRGASLLAIGTATSSWTSLFVRNYDSIPGQMLVLAIILSLALESGNLTRHRVNVCLGLAFGFGMLIKHTVLFLALPPIILAAAPGLFSSRRSVLNFFLTLVLLGVVFLLTWVGIHLCRSPYDCSVAKLMIMMAAQILFITASCFVWLRGRQAKTSSGFGLFTVASTCGLVCAGWYFSKIDLWELRVNGLLEDSVTRSLCSDFWHVFPQWSKCILSFLSSFYWGGWMWLLVGTILLLNWSEKAYFVRFLLTACVLVVGPHILVPAIDFRYIAPLLPALLIVGFLWAARWRASFVACVIFMLLAGTLQVCGWVPSISGMASRLGLELVPTSDIYTARPEDWPNMDPVVSIEKVNAAKLNLPATELPPVIRPQFLWDFTKVPIADPPDFKPTLLDAIPESSRVLLVWGGPGVNLLFFLEPFVAPKASLCSVDGWSALEILNDADYDHLILADYKPPSPPPELSFNPSGPPQEFVCRVGSAAIHMHLYPLASVSR